MFDDIFKRKKEEENEGFDAILYSFRRQERAKFNEYVP